MNLYGAGLDLRNIQIADLVQLVADIIHNFQMIGQLPGFLGQQGESGADGQSIQGARGSKWSFLFTSRFTTAYPTILSGDMVTVGFLNTQYSLSPATRSVLLSAMNVSDIQDGDVFVLPNGKVIQFFQSTSAFTETSITFEQVKALTENEVRAIVSSMVGNDNTNSPYSIFSAYAKNYADSSSGINTEANPSSALDIFTSGSGLGVNQPLMKFLAPKETNISAGTSSMFITGAAQDYHNLVQRTLASRTVDYIPGIDDFAALAVMQNNSLNGIIIGNKDATTLQDFARIYKTSTGLVFKGSYLPNSILQASLTIGAHDITSTGSIFKLTHSSFDLIDTPVIYHPHLWITNNTLVRLGSSLVDNTSIYGKKVNIYSPNITSNAQFLSVSTNELVKSVYSVNSSVNISTPASVVADNEKFLATNLQVYNESVILKEYVDDALANMSLNVSDFTSLISKDVLIKRAWINPNGFDMNSLTAIGMYYIPPMATSGSGITNAPADYLTTEQDGTKQGQVIVMGSDSYTDTNTRKICQLLIMDSAVEEYTQTLVKSKMFFRYATINKTTEAATWSQWRISDYTEVKAGTDIEISYDRYTNKYTVTHASKATASSNNFIDSKYGSTDTYVRDITVGTNGHVTSKELITWKPFDEDRFNSRIDSIFPPGIMVDWHGNTIPSGWVLCDGFIYDLAGNFIVWTDIATVRQKLNQGVYVMTPNLNDRFVYYTATMSAIGTRGGYKNHRLSVGEMPSHTHELESTSGQTLYFGESNDSGKNNTARRDNDYSGGVIPWRAKSIGGSLPHNNMPPYYMMAKIMKLPTTPLALFPIENQGWSSDDIANWPSITNQTVNIEVNV